MATPLKKIILISFVFMFVLLLFQNTLYARHTAAEDLGGGSTGSSGGSSQILNPDDYDTTLQSGDASYIFSKGGNLLKILRNIAAIISVVTISILGIRYMLGSVEQKAAYKETMVPVVIGCVLVASLAGILTIISSIF